MAHAAPLDHVDVMRPPPECEPGVDVYNEKLGMWIFLGSETMFFTALIGSYVILRVAHPSSWKAPGEVLAIPITAINTFLLICSSVTMVKAYASIQGGNLAALKKWLIATVVIGATFVGVQAYEYEHLIAKGFVPSEGLYGSTFYTMTGFHGFHVSIGVICLMFVTWRAFQGKYSAKDHRGVEVIGLYWHFVDLVWIILFTIVYLI